MNWREAKNIVVLTGAGVSVGSGLGTYRGPGGLWEGSGVPEVATGSGFTKDPWAGWQFFIPLLESILEAEPNPAHFALAKMEQECTGNFLLVTQNVDGLHTEAGSGRVAEYHGNMLRRRCSSPQCSSEPFVEKTVPSRLPLCEQCGNPVRPDIVLFEEMIPADPSHRAKRALRTVDLFLSIGTSGTVTPAAGFVRSALYSGAHTVEFNLHESGVCHEAVTGPVEETLPRWMA